MKPLSPHEHSGRYLPKHHTSHAVLAIMMAMTGLFLVLATRSAQADTATTTISAVVHNAPPSQPPTITSPATGSHTTVTPIDVNGTCISTYKVVLFANGTMAGSTICQNDGTFDIKIDLIIGRNDLVARQYDGLDQASPDSNTVVVFLDRTLPPAAPVSPGGTPAPQQQLVLRSDSPYKVGQPGNQFDWPFAIIGGSPPYAVSINWGDGSTDVISIAAAGSFHGHHSYTVPGNYHVTVQASDSKGQHAYLELLVVISGEIGGVTAGNTGYFDGGVLLILWPLYILMFLMLLAFWLGERIEYYKVKHDLITHPYERL